MAKYDWNINQIQSTITDERKFNALQNEINGNEDLEINRLFNRKDTFLDFKRIFRHDFITLCRIDEDMLEYLFFLYEKLNVKDLAYIEMPQHDMDEEELVTYIREFYDSLGDKEISTEIDTILNPDNHLLRIKNKEVKNPISDLVKGRVIKSNDDKTVYGSFYKIGNDEDTVILAHEVGHMLAHRLFTDKENDIMKYFLTEVESYYMELLCGQFLGEKYDLQKLALCFRSNRLIKAIDNIWDVHIQYVMNNYLLNVNYQTLDKELKKEGYPKDITKEEYDKFIKIPLLYRAKMINSYLVALELFRLTLTDKEKGIRTYKKLFRSDISNYQKLLNKYKINYLNGSDTLDCMYEESKALKKVLSEM
jgi:hypothetical protein